MAATRKFLGKAFDRLIGKQLCLPPETCNYATQVVTIPLPDVPTLAATLYQPLGQSPLGTVLVRGPYGRGLMIATGSARVFASRGYQVLFVSSRGTFGSTGTFNGGSSEARDGHGVVTWMRQQPWYTGSFATLGMSYSGFTQWALLSDPPSDMVAAVILAAPHDYAKHVWGTGAFNMQHISWSHTIVTQETASLVERYKAMDTLKYLLPIIQAVPLADGVNSHFSGPRAAPWLSHAINCPDPDDPSWAPLRHNQALDRTNIPVLLITGWQDIFFEQTMEQYERLSTRGCTVSLIVGPWTHLQILNKTSAPTMLEWLHRYVAGDKSVRKMMPVQIYVQGLTTSEWLELPSWPPSTTPHTLYLAGRNELSHQPPPAHTEPSSFVFDPADPTPAVGGPMLTGGGTVDDSTLTARRDVVTFTSEPISRTMKVLGKPCVRITHSSDRQCFDLLILAALVDRH
ncbi:hydrolase [Fusarium denticulatum]|uniref:Hydrolase n=1 Tax=Fusarium denticulatum TaxID=48507 RepID=A0A8H5U945_9HYPO|nr:hydrolase [Fusarium denticulatum]